MIISFAKKVLEDLHEIIDAFSEILIDVPFLFFIEEGVGKVNDLHGAPRVGSRGVVRQLVEQRSVVHFDLGQFILVVVLKRVVVVEVGERVAPWGVDRRWGREAGVRQRHG